MDKDRIEMLMKGSLALIFLLGMLSFGVGLVVALWVAIWKVWSL